MKTPDTNGENGHYLHALGSSRPPESFRAEPSVSLRSSRLLEKGRAGELVCVAKINFGDPRVVENACLTRPDAVWLCNEHVPNDWVNLENQIRAARLYDVDTIVRVAKGSYSDYLKPFESDATGIMVPHVSDADEARALVSRLRFRPLGERPLDGGGLDGRFCRVPVGDYIRHSNDQQFLIFQIESPRALENVEEIAAVEGYDVLLFGAGDYAHLSGHLENMNHPDIVAARKRVGAAARRHGKLAMLASMPDSLPTLVEEGYTIFNVAADVVGLGAYFSQKVGGFFNDASALNRRGPLSNAARG